ncbi:MAG: hypothetical protein KGK00_16895 [Paracoccaceae bacterium]|nr:hypothetical protein [Paracoccaceae bacterium]
MQITFSDGNDDAGPRQGPIVVGWLRTSDKAGILYDPPERVSFRQTNRGHAKSAARCPAVIQLESRYFLIRCPFDLHLGFKRDDKGQAVLVNRAGAGSAVRPKKLAEALTLVAEAEWRYPDRPTVQLSLPYVFIADEPVWITQLDAFAHYRRQPLPGTIFGGRFPVNLWPRPLMWAFEWHEPEKDIILKRGDPLFYVQFEGYGPDRPVQVVEAERTPELSAYMEMIGGVVGYVNQTFGLFRQAEAVRPAKLLKPKGEG